METMAFEPGMPVYDPATKKVGEYQGKAGPYAMLRPVDGGREWEADPALIGTYVGRGPLVEDPGDVPQE